MAMDFSVKDARQLIEQHKTMLSNLEYVISKSGNISAEVGRLANNLVAQSVLRRLIFSDCSRAVEVGLKSAETERLIHSLYKYQSACPTIDAAKAFRDYAEVHVKPNIKVLNPGLAGLSWFFSGKRTKENVASAYRDLKRIMNENYSYANSHLVSDIDSIEHASVDLAWEAYLSSPYLFAETLKTLFPNTFSSKDNNPFQALLTQLASMQQRVARSQTVTDKEKNQIKTSAERVMALNALQILREVPIEEVNRERSGFRVKTLRDAGLTSMADIYSSSTYQLASLHGISENAAFSLKRIAQKFLEEAYNGVKIKLSADNKNPQSTELVKAIYIYRLKNACRSDLAALIRDNQTRLTSATETLEAVGNGIPWLFYLERQRAEVRDAYEDLKSAVEGEYAGTITRLTNILLTDNPAPSADIAWNDFQLHNIEYFSILEEVVPGALGNDDSLYGLPEELAREIQEEVLFPEGLLCTLRRYQEWGVKYILHQKKVLLGDEMGLGKTVQAIATMVSLRNTGATHFVVVCPASVVTNWCREIPRHSKLRVTKIHGSGRNQALKSWVKTGGVAVTTFETTAYIKDESVDKIDLLIVDEAHYIKNPEARRSVNVRRLCSKASRLLFMTGTALENKVEEMVSLIDILQPSVASSVKNMTFMPSAPQFRNRVAPVYYRRKREDVLTELPELIETKEWCVLNPAEKEIYEQNILSKNYAASRRVSWNADDLKKSCKATRLLEIIAEAEAEGRKVLVFSFFLDTVRAIGELLGTRCYGPINGSVPPQRRQDIIDEFDNAPAGSVLLAQIQSGGTGLNIQSASVVVICEPQFKPSIENQAIARAYRMGQSRNVLVYRLLCENTIDEKIMELLEYKQEIFDAFADKSVAAEHSEAYSDELDEKKFGQLIQEEIDRINAERSAQTSSDAD